MATITARKAELLARAEALKARARGIEAELTSHNTPDWEELATEREGDEVLEGMGQEAAQELRAIAAALTRIEGGDYGLCQVCGAPISEARLDIVPFTPFCKDCAK
ncbi:TraR/DksA C4-type zinc finger protein [Rhodobacter sp. KR11]|jgi:RNA polymerase-binding transcription factor DksA|uniref:TraR/DksA family transcriptional regulator n=1 Tax=Rhodobacter sp. KR11 TaxID=2974588 RepID=UPI002223301C|nr:TraR/DksA C4-type zinc finger protein [Rhodobacter sp. KR11]MCW1919335.1 TraR/DksA C4-type zinc finger protein [Rhodobacter sp. KR11]